MPIHSKNFEYCSIEVSKSLGRELTKEEKEQLQDELEALIQKFDKDGQAGELNARVSEAIEQGVKEKKAAAFIEKRNAALNAQARVNIRNMLLNEFKDQPKEFLKALFENSLANIKGAKNGVSRQISAKESEYIGGLAARLYEKNLLKLAGDNTFLRETFLAMHALNSGEPGKTALQNFPHEAIEIAKIFNQMNEIARTEANQKGAWIKKLRGYVLRRSHDQQKIKAFGKEEWKKFVTERLDMEQTFPEIPQARIDKALGQIWAQFASGVHVVFGEGGVSGFQGFGNIGKSLSHERVFHFKSPEAEFEYYLNFSQSTNLLDSMNMGLRRMARDTAIMEKLGPNAENNIDLAIQDILKIYDKEENDVAMAELKAQYAHFKKIQWPNVTGAVHVPENYTFAARSQILRDLETMADLGRMAISMISDIPLYALQKYYVGDRTLSRFLEGVYEATTAMIGPLSSKVTPEMMKRASVSGVVLNAMMTPLTGAEQSLDMPGRTSGWVRTFFKFNGASALEDKIRIAAVNAITHDFALSMGSSFNELEEGMKAYWSHFDGTPEEWEMVRKINPSIDQVGLKFLTPENIKEAPLEAFDELPSVKSRIDQIYSKEKYLLNKQKLGDLYDEEFLATHIENFEKLKSKIYSQLEEFEASKTKGTDEEINYLMKQKELVEARIKQAEVQADIAAYLKGNLHREKVRDFFDDLLEGKEPDEVAFKSDRASDLLNRQRGSIGEKLGQKQARSEKRIQELEGKIKEAQTNLGKSIGEATQKATERMEEMDRKLQNLVKSLQERFEKRRERVNEYQQNIGKFIDQARKDAQNKIASNYRNLISDHVTVSSLEVGKTERAMMNQGTRPGSVLGEILRNILHYKSFTFNVTRRHVGGNVIHGYNETRRSLGEALFDTLKDPKGSSFKALMLIMVFGAFFGAVTNALRDVSKGLMPRIPDDPVEAVKLLMAGIFQSGVGGIYGDFLFGEAKNRFGQGPLETLLGPTFRRAGDIVDMWGILKEDAWKLAEGEEVEFKSAKFLNFVFNNAPVASSVYNLYWTRAAFDFAFMNRLQEYINPGYLRHKERRLERQQKQYHLLTPEHDLYYYFSGKPIR